MHRILHILSYAYSVLLYPLFVSTYLMAAFCFVFSKHVMPLSAGYCSLLIGGTFFFTCLVPLIMLLMMKASGRVKDMDVSDRHERLTPYLYTITSFACWIWFLKMVRVPEFLFWSAVASLVVLILVTVITLRWKISVHLSCAGGAVAMLIGMCWQYGIFSPGLIVGLFVAAWLLMLARIYLGAHTALQTVCGFLLGLLLVMIPNLLRYPL